MPTAIQAYCARTGQTPPRQRAEITRCILESLAQAYRETVEDLQAVTGQPVDRIHMVGGGSRNRLLCQLTASAAGLPVIAGPGEATAIGNLLMQARALGELASLEDIRGVVRRSFDLPCFEPVFSADRDEAYHRFRALRKGNGHGS